MEQTLLYTYSTDGVLVPVQFGGFRSPYYACPDMLTLDNIGAADRLRGRVIRGFFRIMRLWRP